MFKNVFRTDPVHLIQWSRDENGHWGSAQMVLFGPQPPDVRRALTAALEQFNRCRRPAESAILRRYFGTTWRDKAGLTDKRGGGNQPQDLYTGGDQLADSDYGQEPVETAYPVVPTEPVAEQEPQVEDEPALVPTKDEEVAMAETMEVADTELPDHLDDAANQLTGITLQDLVINAADLTNVEKVEKVEKVGRPGRKEKLKYLWDLDVYPEDKVSEFKLKICAALGIPIFRQHVWYHTAGQSFPLSYNFLQSGSSQTVDMSQVITATGDSICGMPVDAFLYRNKGTIKIEAYDNFTLLGNMYARTGVTEYHLVDLETWVGPARTQLAGLAKDDKYQLQMLFFGFVQKYFPMMNLAVFVEYIEERSIARSYPQLEPSTDELAYLPRQSALMHELYTLYEGDENRVRRIDQTLQKSLTETTLKVVSSNKGKIINLRVLFDLFTLDEKVDALRLYDQVDGKPIILDKYRTGGTASLEKLIPGVMYFRVVVSEQPRQHLNLFLYPNGAYHIKGVWGEDLHYEFNDVNLLVDRHINPIITRINGMAGQIMYHGGTRVPRAEKSNVKYIDISISLFWKKILTSGEFRQLKAVLDTFVAARIIQEKQIDRSTVSYFFKRGMYEFDPRRIEKSAAVDNYYAYLFNSDIRQKWFMLFENIRVMTVIHRFSDVKIEISGIKEDEYYIFSRYIVFLMSQFMRVRSVVPAAEDRKITKPLSNLKEQDPHLYNFKKLYNSELVYSKLCQKPYQPNLLTQAQYDGLEKEQKDVITRYWNFTTNTDAYYQCPNPKYPHVRFIVGKHPAGYCIPCCKITAPPANPRDKQRQIYDKCIRDHVYERREVERSTSRYIMSYGKPIDIGRLSHLPETSLEPLFYETKPDTGETAEDDELIGAKYYLYGVPQNHPNAPHCGLIYCFSHAMGMNVESLVTQMAAKLERNGGNFQMLLAGTISQWFQRPEDLAAELRATFIGGKRVGTATFTRWNELVQDMMLQFFEISTLTFEDRNTVIQLRLPDYLDNLEDLKYPDHMHMIVLHNLATDYWNPIYILHKDLYFRAGIIDRKLFNFQSDIVQLVMEMIRNKLKDEPRAQRLTYDVLRQFVTQSSRYTIKRLLVTRDNLCYGVQIDTVGYVPVHMSHFKYQEDLDISFASRDIDLADPQRLSEFCSRYNMWVAHQSEKSGFVRVDVPANRPLLERVEPIYPILQPQRWLVHRGKCIAWQSHNLNFYISHITAAQATRLAAVPMQEVIYNPLDVNSVLERSVEPVPDRRTELVDRALYHNYLYQLLVLEFIQMFNRQRNVKMREQIKRLLLRTDFKNSATLNARLQELVAPEQRNTMLQADVEKIKTQIMEWLLSGDTRKRLLQDIDNDYYNFDLVTIERLKKLPVHQIREHLKKLAAQFVEIGDLTDKNFRFPNILTSCHDNKSTPAPGYCRRGRLIISQKNLDRYLEILAAQIKNPFVEKYLFSPLFQTSLIDYFSFTRRAGEEIEIEFI